MKPIKILAAIAFSFIGSISAFAQGVELNPAYITGRVSISNAVWTEKVSDAYVYVNADGGFSSSTGTRRRQLRLDGQRPRGRECPDIYRLRDSIHIE
jgi:hypothetical protein